MAKNMAQNSRFEKFKLGYFTTNFSIQTIICDQFSNQTQDMLLNAPLQIPAAVMKIILRIKNKLSLKRIKILNRIVKYSKRMKPFDRM